MAKKYESPADPFDLKHISGWLDIACSDALGKAPEAKKTEARSMLVAFCTRIEILLRDAQPTDGSAEEERKRVDATRQLLQLYRLTRITKVNSVEDLEQQRDLVPRRLKALSDAGQPNLVGRLRCYIDDLAQQVFGSADPLKALAFVLKGKTKRGAKKKNDYRDFVIAADVAELMQRGMKLDDACDRVAEQTRLESETTKNIYHQLKKSPEVKAEVAQRALYRLGVEN